MILSFHPIFTGDQNRLCAGREPDEEDLAAIRSADAVILPQGCRESLYFMAKGNCPRIFPDYEARFAYPDKLGQIRLFRKTGVPHPQSHLFSSTKDLKSRYPLQKPPLRLPFVFKFAWGGEGETVFLVDTSEDFEKIVAQASEWEETGQAGFLIQSLIPCRDRSLRVVVIGKRLLSYWRVQKESERFHTGLSRGAAIDWEAEPALLEIGASAVQEFCSRTRIDLAGFDLLFDEAGPGVPLFLEINYYFGRKGIGGSDRYYEILEEEIRRWLESGD